MYYGIELATGKTIHFDRKDLPIPHRAIFGVAGSGKTFLVRKEIAEIQKAYPEDLIISVDFFDEFAEFAPFLGKCSVFRMSELMEQDIDVFGFSDSLNVITLFNLGGEALKQAKRKVIQILLNNVEAFYQLNRAKKCLWIYIDFLSDFLNDEETRELVVELFKKARMRGCILTFTEPSFTNFTAHEEGLHLLGYAGCFTFLRQYRKDCKAIQEHFYASEDDIKPLLDADSGTGLIYLDKKGKFTPFYNTISN